ncbi:MAG: glycosyltransferase family 4 protein [Rhodobacteraceae bacterium]|nr:glycosyltransferase family 4 protein [Paracoccaceae bacterium]
MRVLHFLWGLQKGGAENLAVDLANQQSLDHEVILLVGNDCVDPAVRGQLDRSVRFVHLGRPAGSRNPYWIIRLLLTIHRLRPEVIHSHTRDLALLGRFIFRPMIVTVHSINMDLARSLSRYTRVCCISEAVLADVRRRYPALNLRQVDNGIVVSKIATTANRAHQIVLRAVQVSRLVHEIKGQDLLVRALAAVNAKHLSPAMTIDFIGDGQSLGYLSQLAEELGVREHCNFLGALNRENVYAHLCDYDLLVQPSRYEGFGLTVAEGMAAGIPVLVSDIEGPMEIIRHGEYGYYFESNNVASLANALGTVIEDIRSGVAKQRSIAARRCVEENYGLQRTSAQYCAIYSEVVASFQGSR